MEYRILQEEELDILGKKELFKENIRYRYNTYIKVYGEKFQDFSLPVPPKEIIIDFNGGLVPSNTLGVNYDNQEIVYK